MRISMLADYGDEPDRVMDDLLSEYGGELEDFEWGEVERQIQECVDELVEAKMEKKKI